MGERGGQPGNQNARKHGFYSRILTETEKQYMEEAEGVTGLDGEIAMLRIKFLQLLQNQPDRIDLHLKAAGVISRLVKTRHSITQNNDEDALTKALTNVYRDVGVPLGIKFTPWQDAEEA
ncbi:hypothetical protein ACFLW2_02870 [Chloroflexota bacterium]